MAKEKHLEDLSAIAAQTTEKTRGAMDTYFNFMQKSFSAYPWSNNEVGEKLKRVAEENIAAFHEYVRKMSQAKDLSDVMQVQTEFIKSQMVSFADQVKEIGETCFKAATDSSKKFGPTS
jgi:hypothetical protein